ncbi:MAG: phenylalanyl-tRNA synthetase beta chain [Actinomycetota bacterium]|jgi:phenylalanyl-tRNA synthetase beta chain|nr:phenylalanyl-tRNA synthetase beta chain [Actinomycetota bacterium]
MLVPLSWLRDFAPFDLEARSLGLVFDNLGMVVEGIESVGAGLDGVVVARILSISPISGLDRVRLTTVDDGSGGEPLEVACGAWNISVGDVVPLATVGTTLPNGMTIGRRKLKKVVSNGMLCSAIELGLGADADGILQLDKSLPLGTPLREALGIETDVVFDLAIEGNRPDANSIAGVARDAAAKLGLPFTLPSPVVDRKGPPSSSAASVTVEAPDLAPRFTATVITGVSIGPSPSWVQRRLTLAGMRPINNVVDASNYVMLELGQPTHPYDLDKLAGGGLRVRRAAPGEVVTTLDGVDRVVGEGDDCLICDAADHPIGIAGVFGGASTEISSSTTNVLLEAAYFAPMAIARTSKRLRLRTEASARFERGVDPAGIDLAVARFCSLLGSGEVASTTLDSHEGLQPPAPITLRTARLNALLGTSLVDGDVPRYLEPIGFTVTPVSEGVQSVTPPTFRPDATLEVDLIEEVARHYGYANIPRTVPHSPQVGRLSEYQADRRLVRSILVGAGVDEAQTPSLLGPGDHERAGLVSSSPIAAADAMIVEESLLRTSLLPGLLRSLAFNAARRSPDVAFFEVGPVFTRPAADRVVEGPDAALPDERERVSVALAGDAVAAKHVLDELVEGLRLVGVSLEAVSGEEGLHPARTARVKVSGTDAGVVGEVDPAVVAAWGLQGRVGWLDLHLQVLLRAPRKPLEQLPISKFPSSDIDLAFVLPEDIAAGTVEAALRAGAGDLLSSVDLFDVYRGDQVPPGTRSLAYRLRFVALDRTLTDADVAAARAAAITAAQSAGATLRS